MPPSVPASGPSSLPTVAQCMTLARLPPSRVGMIIDKGGDFPHHIHQKLVSYGHDMWLFREHTDRQTTRALNSYHGDLRKSRHISLLIHNP